MHLRRASLEETGGLRLGRVRRARDDPLDVAALVCIDNHETENMHLLRLALDLLCRHFRLQSRG